MRQGHATLGAGCKELEALVVDHSLQRDPSDLLGFCISNLMWRLDANGNLAPDKRKSTGRIDPVVSLIMAIALSLGAVQSAPYQHEVIVI